MIGLYRGKARAKRAAVFLKHFEITADTRILDLGSEDVSNIDRVLRGTGAQPDNVHIADISSEAIRRGQQKFGYTPVLLNEDGTVPFPDRFFDVVYCSSVIEHVTIPKEDVWSVRSSDVFLTRALTRQREFAREIMRVGRSWFVQTPYKWFPIESHTWLPFVGWLPRPCVVSVIRLSNRIWIKQTSPDFNLLDISQFGSLFPDSKLIRERSMGMTKSLMVIGPQGS